MLITRYLDFAVPYRQLFGTRRGPNIENSLVDGLGFDVEQLDLVSTDDGHELLEHRWFLSEQAGREVGTDEAVASYVATVLPHVPDEQRILLDDRVVGEPPV